MPNGPTTSQADPQIAAVVVRMAATPGVVAVLLSGSRATGNAGPCSDVDLIAITGEGEWRRDTFDADGLTFDSAYVSIADLEARIAADGATCDACRELVTLVGDPGWEARIEATARRLYPSHVPDSAQQAELRAQVWINMQRILAAGSDVPPLTLAAWGGDLVWNAAKVCMALVGHGPLREVHWHDALRAAALPFDAATVYARWFTGGALPERLPDAPALAEFVLDGVLPAHAGLIERPAPPAFEWRGPPGPEEAVELHRMVRYGLGKYGKAAWTGDPVRQALEATPILWLALPACLALAGACSTVPRLWRAIPAALDFPFPVADLYTRAMAGDSLATRLAAAVELGERTQAALEPLFHDTPHAAKYRRP